MGSGILGSFPVATVTEEEHFCDPHSPLNANANANTACQVTCGPTCRRREESLAADPTVGAWFQRQESVRERGSQESGLNVPLPQVGAFVYGEDP